MKRGLLLLSALLMIGGINAQTYVPMKDFQDQLITSQGWQSYVVLSTPGSYDWTTQDLGSPGNYYAIANGYNGAGADATVLFLISPAFDLTSATLPELNFRNATNFNGPALGLLISTDYDGVSDPSVQGTWNDITSMANWSPGTYTWVDGGPVDLSAYNGNNSCYIAFVYASDPGSGAAAWEVDEIEIAEPTVVTPTNVSIYDIQNSTGASPYEDSLVSTGGIVTGIALNGQGYFIQAGEGPFSGVFVSDSVNSATVARGDSVLVTGIVGELFGLTNIFALSGFSIESNGNPEPAAYQVTTAGANDEQWESTKVTTGPANCLFDNDGFGQWGIHDGSDTVLIGYLMYDYPTPTIGNTYWVTGCGYYSYGEWKIMPRDLADIQDVTGIEENELSAKVYPNPSNGIVHIENTYNKNVEVYNTLGSLVMTTTSNQVELKSGVYLIKVGNKTSRVVVM